MSCLTRSSSARAVASSRSHTRRALTSVHRGDRLDAWTGVSDGLLKIATVSRSGKAVTLAGMRTGGWFGEGTVLKNEPRQYDLVVLRDTRLALMERATFLWLFENSVGFNRFLVRQLNERLGQFIAFVEYDRSLDAPGRLARSIAWLFNPVLYRDPVPHLEISQEEAGLLSACRARWRTRVLRFWKRRACCASSTAGVTVLDYRPPERATARSARCAE